MTDSLAAILTGDPTADAPAVYHSIGLVANCDRVATNAAEVESITRIVVDCWNHADAFHLAAHQGDEPEFLRSLTDVRDSISIIDFVTGMRHKYREASVRCGVLTLDVSDNSYASAHECLATCCVRLLYVAYTASSPQSISDAIGGAFEFDEKALKERWPTVRQWLDAIPRLDLSESIALAQRESSFVITQMKDAGTEGFLEITIDHVTSTIFRHGTTTKPFPQKPWQLFVALHEARQPVQKRKLIDQMWPGGSISENTLDQHRSKCNRILSTVNLTVDADNSGNWELTNL